MALAWIERRERHHQARWTKGPCAGSISPTTAWSIAAAKRTVSTSRGAASSNPSISGIAGAAGRVVAKIHPDVALHLAHRVAADPHPAGGEGLARHQGRDRGALPAGVEAPAVIAALDLAPVETAGAEPHAAMRAHIAQRERHAGGVAADQHRLAEHHLGQHRPRFQPSPGDRVVPRLAQRRGAVLHPPAPENICCRDDRTGVRVAFPDRAGKGEGGDDGDADDRGGRPASARNARARGAAADPEPAAGAQRAVGGADGGADRRARPRRRGQGGAGRRDRRRRPGLLRRARSARDPRRTAGARATSSCSPNAAS